MTEDRHPALSRPIGCQPVDNACYHLAGLAACLPRQPRRLSSTRRCREVSDLSIWIDHPAELRPIFQSKNTENEPQKKRSAKSNCLQSTQRCSDFTSRASQCSTGAAIEQKRFPKRFSLLDLALLGIATHKLSRIIAKDRITGILRAPFVSYIRSAGAGEVEEEPRGRGIQRGIGQLISCPYCMAPWCAIALAFGLVFAPRATRFFAGILTSVAASDFLQRAYLAAKGKT